MTLCLSPSSSCLRERRLSLFVVFCFFHAWRSISPHRTTRTPPLSNPRDLVNFFCILPFILRKKTKHAIQNLSLYLHFLWKEIKFVEKKKTNPSEAILNTSHRRILLHLRRVLKHISAHTFRESMKNLLWRRTLHFIRLDVRTPFVSPDLFYP